MELGKAGFLESGMDKSSNRPRFIVACAVHVGFRTVDYVVAVGRGTRLGDAATGFAQNRDPRAIFKVVDDEEAVFFQMFQTFWCGSKRERGRVATLIDLYSSSFLLIQLKAGSIGADCLVLRRDYGMKP